MEIAISIIVIISIVGIPAYIIRLILDHVSKNMAKKITENIIKEFEDRGLLEQKKLSIKDVTDMFMDDEYKEIDRQIQNKLK